MTEDAQHFRQRKTDLQLATALRAIDFDAWSQIDSSGAVFNSAVRTTGRAQDCVAAVGFPYTLARTRGSPRPQFIELIHIQRRGAVLACENHPHLPYDGETTMRLTTLAASLLMATLSLPSHAVTIVYTATLDGPSESPPNASPGTGSSIVTVDTAANTMRVQATFDGLQGTTTAAHIHCCTAIADFGTAGVVTTTPSFPGFPLGVSSGVMDTTFNMTLASSYNPAFLNNATNLGSTATAFATLLAGLAGGQAYFNIHSSMFGGGEIRGFLHEVPEPGTLALLGLGLLGLGLARRRST